MNTARIREIQSKTPYPNSQGVADALMQVCAECGSNGGGTLTPYTYRMVPTTDAGRDGVEPFLNRLGEKGWELVALDFGCFIFKRIKREASESATTSKPAGPFASDGEIASKMEQWGDALAAEVSQLEEELAVLRTPRTAQQIVDQTNALARDLYRIRGYLIKEGYRFDQSTHPYEREAWLGACAAQEVLTSTDPNDALSELDD